MSYGGSYRDDRGGRPYRDDRSKTTPRGHSGALDEAPKVFVGNLSFDTTEEDFRAYFERIGKITEVLMPRDIQNDRIKGYGFITFEDFDTMHRAIEKLNGSEFLGNNIKVDRANARERTHTNTDRGGGGGGGYDRGGYDRGGSYDRGGGSYNRGGDDRGGGGGGFGGGARPERKPVGYRCRVSGLAPDIGWQLLKDFLRQAGDVTYANVDPDGLGVGEYQSLAECRDAIEKLSGAALDGHIVKLTPLNFDMETGERRDRPGSGRPAPYDDGRSGGSNRGYDDRRGGGGSYNDDRRGGGSYNDDRRGGGNYNSGGYNSGGRDGGAYNADRGGGGGRGGYDSGRAGSGDRGYGGGDRGYDRSADRSYGRTGGGYDSSRAGGGGGNYTSNGGGGGQYNVGGSSRYGGGGGSNYGGSSKYGGSGSAPAPPTGGGSSRYGGGGGGDGYSRGGDGGNDGYRGGGGPDRNGGGFRSDRHGPYDR